MAQSIKDKLKALEKQNQLLTGNLVDAVWVINAGTLVYEYITPSIYEISGYTAEELIHTSISDRLLPESLNKVMGLIEGAIKEYEQGVRKSKSIDLELLHKNGGTYWIEVQARFMEEGGSPLKIVGVTRNITARKTAELQLEEQNRKLTDALAEKERLLKEIKVLQSLLPICSGCKRIRDDDGKWWPLDAYVEEHTDSEITHTICEIVNETFSEVVDESIESLPDTIDIVYEGFSKTAEVLKEFSEINYTGYPLVNHSVNVMVLALSYCLYNHFSEDEAKRISLCALLHDVGLTKLPVGLVSYNGRLTDQQYLEYQAHASIGHDIIKMNENIDSSIAIGILEHHEHLDGSGWLTVLRFHRFG